MSDEELTTANARLAGMTAFHRVSWAAERFPGAIAASSSFGADSAVVLHLVACAARETPIVSVDTGFLFDRTHTFRDSLIERLGLDVRVYRPRVDRSEFLEEHGAMWRSNPDACCAFNKREPFDRAKREMGLAAWITGIRREQSHARRQVPFVQRDFDGLIKICPIAEWSTADVHYYMLENDLPYHPLRAEGFLSIGCQPEEGYCTRKVAAGEDPRAGRWAGFDKTECGLHTFDEGSGI